MNNLKNDLINIGICKGMSLEVHSSVKSISDHIIDLNGVINDFKEIITSDGNIVMPAFPLSKCLPLTQSDLSLGIKKKNKWLDENHNRNVSI